ncbi:hypothetical protein [Thermohalobacter berrensis]|uniref:Uncharacterized protein n=1 Tax=Thermohalobacter berrensis TaxID=99594 RepID=A0A419TB40_9FIRM|nr:hypothetical protein [Thermohalobacter berrensis]RKD34667.1 hypothetical protein BET03_02235 [Thermohalobacter berrensis]
MTTSPVNLWEIYEGLKYRFLFNSDINSIHMLLSLYDLEENINNIYPRYISTNKIKNKIKHILKNKNNNDIIAQNISSLIHEDISRLELCFYLEGYKYGFYNNRWINALEEKAVRIQGLEKLYKSKYLFHFDFNHKEIHKLHDKFMKEIDSKEKKDKYISNLVYTFSNKIIKKKVKEFDKYIDKQLKMDFTPYNFTIKEENYSLRESELDKIYKAIVNVLIKNLKKIYKDASWYAINDKVLRRYL